MSAGSKIYIISVDALDVKMSLNASGNAINTPETTKQMIPVTIRPDETIEPMDFLSFLHEKYETFRDKTTGIPLDTKVMRTAKILIAT